MRRKSKFFKKFIKTHTESLKDSLAYFTNELKFDVVNPSSDENIQLISDKLESYDGLIWGGNSLNIYNDTPEIRRQIEFMKDCQKNVKKILAICWDASSGYCCRWSGKKSKQFKYWNSK